MRCLFLIGFVFMAGCASEPVPYHSGNEIPRGPGLLTGAEGAFVLNAEDYRKYQDWRKSQQPQAPLDE
jgi:hypothetical protein